MKPWKYGPLSYSRSTDMDGAVVLMHHLEIRVGRVSLKASLQTAASVALGNWWAVWDRTRAEAIKSGWGDEQDISWHLDNHFLDGGTKETALMVLQRIADGTEPKPDWMIEEGGVT